VLAVLARADERGQRGSDSTCMRQRMQAYVSIRQRMRLARRSAGCAAAIAPAYVSIRQRTSAYGSDSTSARRQCSSPTRSAWLCVEEGVRVAQVAAAAAEAGVTQAADVC
jgi:hypothetical protein